MSIVNRDLIIRELSQYYHGKTEVLFGYLFGSYAQNRYDHGSDIDIGIYLTNYDGELKFKYKLEETVKLQEMFNRNIDLIIINEAPPLLRHEIFRHGILFKDQDHSFLIEFRVNNFYKYLDQSFIINRYFEANKAKIQGEVGYGKPTNH
jgi:predicted nucleotidyltransferase